MLRDFVQLGSRFAGNAVKNCQIPLFSVMDAAKPKHWLRNSHDPMLLFFTIFQFEICNLRRGPQKRCLLSGCLASATCVPNASWTRPEPVPNLSHCLCNLTWISSSPPDPCPASALLCIDPPLDASTRLCLYASSLFLAPRGFLFLVMNFTSGFFVHAIKFTRRTCFMP